MTCFPGFQFLVVTAVNSQNSHSDPVEWSALWLNAVSFCPHGIKFILFILYIYILLKIANYYMQSALIIKTTISASNRCWHFHPCGLNYKTSPATPQALWLVNQLRQYASSTVINQPTKAALEKTHHLLLSQLLNPIPVYKYSPRVTFRDM